MDHKNYNVDVYDFTTHKVIPKKKKQRNYQPFLIGMIIGILVEKVLLLIMTAIFKFI